MLLAMDLATNRHLQGRNTNSVSWTRLLVTACFPCRRYGPAEILNVRRVVNLSFIESVTSLGNQQAETRVPVSRDGAGRQDRKSSKDLKVGTSCSESEGIRSNLTLAV